MKVWKLNFAVEDFDGLAKVGGMDYDETHSYDGRKKKREWQELHVERMEPEDKLPLCNAPVFYSGIPVFDLKAIEVLRVLFNEDVEILPLDFKEKEYFLINIITVLDCIDYEKSEYKCFSDGKRIMRFIKYVFRESKVKAKHIFKIKDNPFSTVFVSDEFRNRVIEAKLTGFVFKLVWDSKTLGKKEPRNEISL